MRKITGKQLIGLITLTGTLAITGCATANSHDKEMMAKKAMMGSDALAMADADLKAATAAGAQWRLIDKATGGKAVNLKKLLAVAHKKAEAGETEEANRIAGVVSKASKISIEQSERYAGATPYYN